MTYSIEKQKNAFKELKDILGIENVMQRPRITKVIVATGVGKITDRGELAKREERLQKITGQKPLPRPAKKSIAGFKSREGQIVGYQVTLRGPRMTDFLSRFFEIALPRTHDFRGVSRTTVDEMGNMTIGIKEHTIFPETADEDSRDIFGLAVTFVTNLKNKKDAEAFFEYIGVPFKKSE
jgi:large subunit ribosomal protein L5